MKPTPCLLITRFAPHAQILADKLKNNGYASIAQPLFKVHALKDPKMLRSFINHEYDIVIAVSRNAVKYTHQQLIGSWPEALYLAVGDATQKQLNKVTNQLVLTPLSQFDSEGLLALDALQSVKSKRILILRGEGGRDLLAETLSHRGAKVEFFQTYKRVKIDLDGDELVNNWQQAAINGAIISSIEILNQLFTLVSNKHNSWLSELILYVPSQRVAIQATKLGAKHVVLLPSLDSDQIVKFFKTNNGSRE
ncbi:uroporphyrinogen-III synthase [Psychromonas sp. RZ22]|uniref:uroporphyrinogen-III synthase n=1 Tax=Psychromonas algarum TaxID=2555643 RepID=UPI0010683273|nr:uroporphyrinogen-III synthase [Psychromonas sp. RZ22]TEW54000.1 uroporphyrinogen-III synthase [Psychromonas sp. RZ22]